MHQDLVRQDVDGQISLFQTLSEVSCEPVEDTGLTPSCGNVLNQSEAVLPCNTGMVIWKANLQFRTLQRRKRLLVFKYTGYASGHQTGDRDGDRIHSVAYLRMVATLQGTQRTTLPSAQFGCTCR